MGEFITIIFDTPTGEKCVICGFKLTKKFPEDFPDEWKMCCPCIILAENIIIHGKDKLKYMCFPNECEGLLLERLEEMYKLITIVI